MISSIINPIESPIMIPSINPIIIPIKRPFMNPKIKVVGRAFLFEDFAVIFQARKKIIPDIRKYSKITFKKITLS